MSLVNTKHLPPGFKSYIQTAKEARAYYELNPYPYFGFASWKTEDMGPLPRCLPIARAITNRSATWLFGKEVHFKYLNNRTVDKSFHEIWRINKMQTKLLLAAKIAGVDGGISLKYSYDGSNKQKPVRIDLLRNTKDVKHFYDPHDKDKILMSRVQYPYFNGENGQWYWHREEWTEDEFVTYIPTQINEYGVSASNPYEYTGSPIFPKIDEETNWEIDKSVPNPFKRIPIIPIVNIDNNTVYGAGDLFTLYRALDRINLAYHLMDKSNQLDVNPITAFIDLEPKEGDQIDRPMNPQGTLDLKTVESDDGTTKQGKIQTLEANGAMREHLYKYADDMKQMLFDATGAVFPRQEHFTNKGAMTQSVLMQLYAPLLEVTGEKQKNYGENGIVPFIQEMALGLRSVGVAPFNKLSDSLSMGDDKLEVDLTWFSQFEATEDEKFAFSDRISREVDMGLLPTEIAIDKIAKLEEVKLTEEQFNELKTRVDKRLETMQDNVETKGNNGINGRTPNSSGVNRKSGNDPGGSEDGQSKSRPQVRGSRVKDAS